jgi:hypothetical protein
VISVIHFYDIVRIGPGATPYSHLQNGQMVEGTHKIAIEFDSDPRFLLVAAAHRDKPEEYQQLIPLTSVCSILMKEKRVKRPESSPGKAATK